MSNKEVYALVMKSVTNILQINASSKALKKFISLLNIPFKGGKDYEEAIEIALTSLTQILGSEKRYEVFSFSGKSGVRLLLTDFLPKKGFCFCASVFLERNPQPRSEMTVFRLVYTLDLTSVENELVLFIKDCQLYYRVLFKIIG